MLTKYINYLISSVSYLIQKRHNMYYLLFDHHKCNTNKQTNKCLIVNQDAHNEQYNQYKSQYTIDSQNNLFIG